MRERPVVTPHELDGFAMSPEGGSDRFGAEIVDVDGPLGLTRLGAMMVTVPPGKRAFPFHNHLSQDEMFVILEGEGTYRFGDGEHAVRPGDVCGAPHGGPETAHQLINSGQRPLRYLGVSNRTDPEVVEYPDSGKFGVTAIAPGESWYEAHLRFIGRRYEGAGYWDGEET